VLGAGAVLLAPGAGAAEMAVEPAPRPAQAVIAIDPGARTKEKPRLHDGAMRIVATSDPAAALAVAPLSEGARADALSRGAFEFAGLREGPAVAAVAAAQAGAAAPPADAEEQEEVLFEADSVRRESETSPIIAEGNVRAFFGARYLRADRLEYDPETDIVIAEGSVSITDESMVTAFAGRVELTGDLRDGIAENFSALLAENAKLAADQAVQEQGARTRLHKAVYTACNVCDSKGEGKTPTWRVKALRVTRDLERQVVRFHHAFFEIKGVPVFYAPFLQSPDPTVERQSGFLTPVIGASSRLGFNFELPYYLAVSNHQDATFSPKYTSNDGVLWQGEYRRRGSSGQHVVQAGVIDFNNTEPDENGNLPVGIPGVRWHFFGKGYRDLGESWRLGYDVERVSDDTYLRRYDIRRRGDLRKEIDTSNTNRLRSNAFARWSRGASELRADAYLFQGLRANDETGLTPYVLPLLNYRHAFQDDIVGGRAQINANFASLQRENGVDTRRFTASAHWEREHVTRSGHRLLAFAEFRGDAFHYDDLDQGTEILPGIPGENSRFEARFAPTAGLEWSYPLTRRAGPARLYLEPRVQLVVSPKDPISGKIINEDSQSIEFDYAGLFEYNKSPGFDAFEDGQRLNAGVVARAAFDNGVSVEGSIGAQFRAQESQAFDPAVGLGETTSDIVGSLNVRYKTYFEVDSRFRFDDETGALRRAEALALLNVWRLSGSVSYVKLDEESAATALRSREELTGSLRVRMTDSVSIGGVWRHDLAVGQPITQDFVIGYADECASLEIVYRRDLTRDIGLDTDNALLIRFTLRSLVD